MSSNIVAVSITRVGWLLVVILTAVYIGLGSVHGTSPDLAAYGGLNACFYCLNGWNWHVLLYTLAFGVFMAEALLAFACPLSGLR